MTKLGFRVRFELPKQVISPRPKMYRLLWYEYDYQHGIKNPNTVLLVRPNVRKCNERLAVNMINKKCITFPDRVASTVLLLLCETSCPPQQQEQGFTRCGARTRDHRREAPLLLLLVFAAGVAVRCCCCCGLGTRTHTRTVPLTSGWRVYIPRRRRPSRLRSKQALTSTVSQ